MSTQLLCLSNSLHAKEKMLNYLFIPEQKQLYYFVMLVNSEFAAN